MRRNVLFGFVLALAIATAGCQDQRPEPTAPPTGAGAQAKVKSKAAKRYSADKKAVKLPAGARISDRHLGQVARRAINPDDYVCPLSTPVVDWYIDEVNQFIIQEPDNFVFLYFDVWADLIPFYESLFLLTEETPQVFGYRGQYTRIMQKTHRDAKKFWDIPSRQIQLLAMKGTMLLDPARVAPTYQLDFVPPFFGLTEEQSRSLAQAIRQVMLQSEVLDGGNHPLFSFNAFAFSPGDGSVPDRIVMGDGILEGYAAVGYGDVAPQAVYAHEFAHHIQYANNYFEDEVPGATTGAELTRYTELMADAMSAYYLTHKRGAGMKRQRVEQFLQVFFQIGDCAFEDPNHHGTPNQRMAAARFGFTAADEARKKGHILSSDQFHDLFVAAYSGLVAPDAT